MSWSTLLLLLLLLFSPATHAGTISLGWAPVNHPDLSGFRIYYGYLQSDYNAYLETAPVSGYTLQELLDCTEYFLAVKSVAYNGQESEQYSPEIWGWARPVVTTISPARIDPGQSVEITVSGINFRANASVVIPEHPEIVPSDTEVEDCWTLKTGLEVPNGYPVGRYDLEVKNPDRTYGKGARILAIGTAEELAALAAPDEETGVSVTAKEDEGGISVSSGWGCRLGSPSLFLFLFALVLLLIGKTYSITPNSRRQ